MFCGFLQVPEGLPDAEEVVSSSSTRARVHHCSNLVDRAVSQVDVQFLSKHFRRKYKKSRARQQKMLANSSRRSAKFAAVSSNS